jgi:hypothetical protein
MPSLDRHYQRILARIESLPDSAYVPVPVAAMHDSVCVETVERNYPLVRLTERLRGVPVGYLRHRGKPVAA